MAALIGRRLLRDSAKLSNIFSKLTLNGIENTSNINKYKIALPTLGLNFEHKNGLRTRAFTENNENPKLGKDFSTNALPKLQNDASSKEKEALISQAVVDNINKQIIEKSHGRLFAIVQIAGKQFKVTDDDLIIVQSHIAPDVGERIRLEKVLLLGSKDFTLIGRPMLNKDVVRIEATVFEKTLSHLKTHFRFKKRKNYRRMHNRKSPYTMLRINTIELTGLVNESKDVEGLDDVLL